MNHPDFFLAYHPDGNRLIPRAAVAQVYGRRRGRDEVAMVVELSSGEAVYLMPGYDRSFLRWFVGEDREESVLAAIAAAPAHRVDDLRIY